MSIIPKDIIITQTAVSMVVEIQSIVWQEKATFAVSLKDSNGGIIQRSIVEMTGEDYEVWGSDDSYAIQFCADQVGVILQSLSTMEIQQSQEI